MTSPARAVGSTTRMHDAPLRRAERERRLAQRSGTVRRISSEARVTVGSISTTSAADAGEAGEAAAVDPDGEDEEPGDDARQPAHRVDDEAHRRREPALDLVEVHGGEDRDGTTIIVAMPTCSSVPMIAWNAPPPGVSGPTLLRSSVKNPVVRPDRPLPTGGSRASMPRITMHEQTHRPDETVIDPVERGLGVWRSRVSR